MRLSISDIADQSQQQAAAAQKNRPKNGNEIKSKGCLCISGSLDAPV